MESIRNIMENFIILNKISKQNLINFMISLFERFSWLPLSNIIFGSHAYFDGKEIMLRLCEISWMIFY